MALGHIARALWRRKVIVLVAVLLTVGAAAWSLSSASNVYESNAKVLLLPDASNPTLVPFSGQAVENLLPTYAQVVESRSFLQDVASGLPFNVTANQLGGAVRAEPVAKLGVLAIIAKDGSPRRAQEMSEATASALIDRLRGNGIMKVSLLDHAQLPTSPISPRPKLVYAVALLAGLLFGGAAAIGWDRFFGRVNTVADLAEVSDLPILAVLPEARGLKERKIVV